MKITFSLVAVLATVIVILFFSCDESNNKDCCSLVYDTYKMQQYEIDSLLFPVLNVIIAKEKINKNIGFNPFVFMGVTSSLTISSDSTNLVLDGIGIRRFDIHANRVYCVYDREFDGFFRFEDFVFCFSHSEYYDTILISRNKPIKVNVSYSDVSTCNDRQSYYPIEPYKWIVDFGRDSIMIDYFYSIEAGVIDFDTTLIRKDNASNELPE